MAAFWVLVACAGVAAVVDWVAVATSNSVVEYAAKPAALAALTTSAVVLPAARFGLVDRRGWFVAALACCLVGDVLLMLPKDLFVPGLAAFLAGHVFFVVGLLQPPSPSRSLPFAFSAPGLAVSASALLVVEAIPATMLFRSLWRNGHRPLIGPVAFYVTAIVSMAVLATNVGIPAAAVGASCFLVSDTLLAWNRFIRPVPGGSLPVHVTYHLAQVLLVCSLLR